MNNNSDIIVSLDIGTTKICALVGKANEDGTITILGQGEATSQGLMRGVITNIDLTVNAIKEAILIAENKAGVKIKDVFVGIAGQHIKSIQHRGYMMRDNDMDEICQEDIDKLIQDMHKLVLPPGDKIIHVLPQEFIVDNEEGIKHPCGMSGVRLEADFHIITGQTTATKNIYRSVDKAGYEVSELILEPIASCSAVLNEMEKEAGVALVDIGGGTTDIAIFHDGIIRHTAVIPLGGNTVTEDVKEGCRVMKKHAERMKVKYGSAVPNLAHDNQVVVIPGLRGGDAKEVSIKALAQIIEARMEEIIEHVYYEIRRSGFEKRLIGGIVLTGGGSQLNKLDELVKSMTGLPTRVGNPIENVDHNRSEALNNPKYATAVGLLLQGLQAKQRIFGNNVFNEQRPEMQREDNQTKGWLGNISNKWKEFFELDDIPDFNSSRN
ncbi:UNVERIFIED_CONTAM: hypothetical protein GTU68_021613 [Idotea baltica]|nr:hypothetical protein [Idotea baltica]